MSYLFPTVILCGIIQIVVGILRFGKFIRLVPHSVMLGFVNGLAIVILLAQFGSFKVLGEDGVMRYLTGPPMILMALLVALTMAIIVLLPKLTKALPSSLVAILVVTGISWGINNYSSDKLRIPGSEKAVLTVQDMLITNLKARAVSSAQKAHNA